MERAFETLMAVAWDGSTENVSRFVPGSNAVALQGVLELGLRITFPMLMMSSEEIGRLALLLTEKTGVRLCLHRRVAGSLHPAWLVCEEPVVFGARHTERRLIHLDDRRLFFIGTIERSDLRRVCAPAPAH